MYAIIIASQRWDVVLGHCIHVYQQYSGAPTEGEVDATCVQFTLFCPILLPAGQFAVLLPNNSDLTFLKALAMSFGILAFF